MILDMQQRTAVAAGQAERFAAFGAIRGRSRGREPSHQTDCT